MIWNKIKSLFDRQKKKNNQSTQSYLSPYVKNLDKSIVHPYVIVTERTINDLYLVIWAYDEYHAIYKATQIFANSGIIIDDSELAAIIYDNIEYPSKTYKDCYLFTKSLIGIVNQLKVLLIPEFKEVV